MKLGQLLFVKKNHHIRTKKCHFAAIYRQVLFTHFLSQCYDEGRKELERCQLSSGGLKSLTAPSRASWRCQFWGGSCILQMIITSDLSSSGCLSWLKGQFHEIFWYTFLFINQLNLSPWLADVKLFPYGFTFAVILTL